MAWSLLGAVMLGVGTLFQPKVRPEDHWSQSPKITFVTEAEQADAGAQPGRRRPRRRRRRASWFGVA
jgi:hypothetical protein